MQEANKKITIHIADDHQIIIDGLMAILEFESDIDVVGYSLNGQQVLDWFVHNSADILLLDINMPDISGLEVMQALKNYKTIPRVIILSSYDNYKVSFLRNLQESTLFMPFTPFQKGGNILLMK